MKPKYFTMIIEDISEGKEKGFAITLPNLHNALIMGETFDELSKGIKMTFDAEHKKLDPELLRILKQQLAQRQKINHAEKFSKQV